MKKFKPKTLLINNPGVAVLFMCAFAVIGGLLVYTTQAETGKCSTTNVIGSVSNSVLLPESTTYKLWVRIQVPDTDNSGNSNGVRVEIGDTSAQCFTVTTASTAAVNQWQWLNSDANNSSIQHTTQQLSSGNTLVKVLSMKNGIKVDKVLLLKSDSSCIPSNDFTNGQPGDNCTTPPPTVNLNADPVSVNAGNATTLTWSSTDANNCSASGGWSGSKAVNGSESTGALTSEITYNLTCNGAGGSATASAVVSVVNVDTQVPTAPTNLIATSNSYNRVNLAWTPSTDNVGVTNYLIIRNGVTIASIGSTSNYSDTTVSAGTSYSYIVKARDAAGNLSTNSNTLTLTTAQTPDTQAPSVPTNLVGVAVSANQINLSWTASTDNVNVTGYDIYRNGTFIRTVTGTSYGDTGLSSSTQYTYYVIAIDAANNKSGASSSVTVSTQSAPISSGTITGVVTDSQTSNALSGVNVSTVVNGTKRTFKTSSNGQYIFSNLPSSTYNISYSKAKYRNTTASVILGSGQSITKNVTLSRR